MRTLSRTVYKFIGLGRINDNVSSEACGERESADFPYLVSVFGAARGARRSEARQDRVGFKICLGSPTFAKFFGLRPPPKFFINFRESLAKANHPPLPIRRARGPPVERIDVNERAEIVSLLAEACEQVLK